MKTFLKVILFLFVIVLSFLVGLLTIHILLSIANLYKLEFITRFSFVQIYGIIILISIIRYKYKKSDDDEKFSDAMLKSLQIIFTTVGVMLSTWGLSFVIYYLIS